MGRVHAVAVQEEGLRCSTRRLVLWCAPYGGGEERGGGVDGRGQGRLPFLPEEVEARAVFPLRKVQADGVRWNPAPPDEAVGGLYQSDSQYTLHLLEGT